MSELIAKIRRDVERILCLDVDAGDFTALGRNDPVVSELQRRFAGLRPVLFYTPYEAAAWCIIGHRIQMTQAATVKQHVADDYGERGAFPSPARLADLASPQRGLTDEKIDQLHHPASAALDGALDRDRLRDQTFGDAERQLQRLPGIGPFSAELIIIRGMGAPDAPPRHERRLEAAARDAYQLPPNAHITAVSNAGGRTAAGSRSCCAPPSDCRSDEGVLLPEEGLTGMSPLEWIYTAFVRDRTARS